MDKKRERKEFLKSTINKGIKEMKRGIMTNECYKAEKSEPLNEKWRCQGSLRAEKCMSVVNKDTIQRDIVVYKCFCGW